VRHRWHRRSSWIVGAVVGAAVAVPSALMATAPMVPSAAPAHYSPAAKAALLRYLSHSAAPMERARPHPAAAPDGAPVSSFNWSGYVDVEAKKGSFTSVSASWTVPSISCSQEDQISSQWVGFDGVSDKTVEQAGTLAQCFQGTAVYYTWYEMYPSGTALEGLTLAPGDQVTATVSHSGASYTLSVTDSTNGANSFSVTPSCPPSKCKDLSAEWIAERPAFPTTGLTPLVDFGTWSPSGASVTVGAHVGDISSFHPEAIDMMDSTSTYNLSTISPATGATAGFTATWNNSY
jgi:hypothetical protein